MFVSVNLLTCVENLGLIDSHQAYLIYLMAVTVDRWVSNWEEGDVMFVLCTGSETTGCSEFMCVARNFRKCSFLPLWCALKSFVYLMNVELISQENLAGNKGINVHRTIQISVRFASCCK